MFYIASEIEMPDNIKHRLPAGFEKNDKLMSVDFISTYYRTNAFELRSIESGDDAFTVE